LSLLDRGFVYAIAHVRGGGELGPQWHEKGRRHHKQNSISDFVACAEYLISRKYTRPQRLALMGESAGGLLVAGAVNQKPELFGALVTDSPFVDVINTLADPSLPLTATDWGEWGDPAKEEDYRYLKKYSPYENVRPAAYPPLLILCSLNDPRVPYWEALKWAARIRELNSGEHEILVKIRSQGGHQGVTDRFDELKEWAFIYSFLIDRLAGGSDGDLGVHPPSPNPPSS
jgi:oligopeptidase B